MTTQTPKVETPRPARKCLKTTMEVYGDAAQKAETSEGRDVGDAEVEVTKVATHLVDDFDGISFSALCGPRRGAPYRAQDTSSALSTEPAVPKT